MPRRDPAEAAVVAECVHCLGEIYEGDEVKRIDSDVGTGFVHDNYGQACAAEYAALRAYDGAGVIKRDLTIE
ncbi:hypothetical protein [Paenibacillus sp. NPDC057967]|uniref:hypothetical protein n=1 Tax=Paenibacillus sp. NPDC057967 TaxID=3346293 RepID=UPI0036DC6E66